MASKFQLTINTEKFKKAVQALPEDPAQSIEFLAFRVEPGKGQDTVVAGLYLGPAMKNDFTKDKGAQKSPELFKGILRRSAKNPAKKLILESKAQPAPLKELGKACLKEAKLKLVVVAMRPGEPEPELTAEELQELGLAAAGPSPTPPPRPLAPTPGARPQPAPPSRPAAPVPGAGPQPAAPPRPRAAPPSATAQPAAPARPAAATPTGQEFDVFKNRLKVMMPRIQDAGTFNPALPKLAVEASQRLAREPLKALAALDEIERELVKASRKKEDHRLLLAAGQLRLTWANVTAAGLETDSVLVARRAAVLEALKRKNARQAGQALAELEKQALAVFAGREGERRKLVGRWLIRNVEDPYDLTRSSRLLSDNDDKTKAFEACASRLAQELNLPVDTARALMEAAVEEMGAQAAEMGLHLRLANVLLPEETRPVLSAEEISAAGDYVGGHYLNINPSLWKGTPPPPPLDATHRLLQEAFKKTKPLASPVRVSRGLNFADAAELNAYLQPFKNAVGTDTLVPLMGYISTGTAGVPPAFTGNIQFTIIAKQGLDMTPFTGAGAAMAKEKELCLNHGTLVKVHRVKALRGGSWLVQVEQMLPQAD